MALKDYQSEMETCCRCSACKFIPLEQVTGYEHANVCPSISRYDFHAYSGGGRMAFGLGLIHGRVEYTPKVAEVVYNCTLCGACDVSCKYAMDMDVLEPLYAVRQECVKHGQTLPVLDKLVATMKKQGPMVLGAKGKRGAWHEGLDVKDYTKEKVPVVYHAGCLAGHDEAGGRAARTALALLQKAGVKVGIANDRELCCGGRAYEMGYLEEARAQAELNVARFKESGAAEIVTGCAHCYQYYKVLYPKLGLDTGLKVWHVTEYLAQLLAKGKLKPRKQVDLTVTYHDPCHLGRLSEPWISWQGKQRERHMRVYDPPRTFRRGAAGVYEPPRDVLKSIPGLKLVEMDRVKEYAWCCGAGGGVKESNPEFARWTAVERLKEAESTGAEALVTACPHCSQNLQGADGDGGSLRVYDIVELLDRAI
ncbi:MAG: (Fe-S)-binding protein [Thermoleophilia bacterium]|nr:(Fe-S)-binding protein [Thermoleophilia bacterium]